VFDGHELANHNMYDYPYDKHTKEDFESDLNSTQNIISRFTTVDTKWYRAPHAKISEEMQTVIDSRGMIHIISDSFANDTAIPDSKWIAEFVLKKVQPGSIIVLHMPERGVREWCFEAMELTLKGLKEKNLDILTLTELEKLQ
jgi:peptidoglycan/xylan/chitin deacetylase (PgdA/CDA1 family)